MTRRRVLIVHPRVTGCGGGNGVAAWTLQALREHVDLSLATLQPLDYDAINSNWGTSLRPGDFLVHLAPAAYQRILRGFPTPAALLEACLTTRWAQNLDRERRYDVLFGTQNEADFGRRGVHYVHHPWLYLPRPRVEIQWYHHIPGALNAYRYLCQRLSRGTNEGLRRNLSIANSSFIADRIRQVHGVDSVVLYPPVTSDFPEVPWGQRQRAIVAVGRMDGCKRWEMAVAIVDEVRRRGHEIDLTLIGHDDDAEYRRRIERLAAERPWFRILSNLTRDELTRTLASHRYGIHTMENEHFGMGPAEILRAGCLLFAHASGGPVEILGGETELLFENENEAADRIERLLSDPAREQVLRARLDARRQLFTTETFCKSLREIVERFES